MSAPHDLAGPKYQNVVEAHKYGVVNPRVKGNIFWEHNLKILHLPLNFDKSITFSQIKTRF